MSLEDIQMEDALFPWLASDCMADETQEPFLLDELPDEYCQYCVSPLYGYEGDTCPECGEKWENDDATYSHGSRQGEGRQQELRGGLRGSPGFESLRKREQFWPT